MPDVNADRLTYAAAGVDRDKAALAVERIKATVRTTFTKDVLADIGSFGAFFQLDVANYREPVLVSSTDGVGTKLKIAFEMNRHDTVGIDLVAMCVNDVLAQGAKPLFFLDYFATSKMVPERFASIIAGIATGCREAGCALIGGENAELPGFYQPDEYDLAGFCVGIVEKQRIIDGSSICAGDVVLGLPSAGLHSNGYSLARKVLMEVAGLKLNQQVEELGCALGDELLRPTRIYVRPVLSVLEGQGVGDQSSITNERSAAAQRAPVATSPDGSQARSSPRIKGIAHITGGGLIENIPRILPQGTRAVIQRGTWREQNIFGLIQRLGNVPTEEMFRTFNMGIGMVVIVPREQSLALVEFLQVQGEGAMLIGEVQRGGHDVQIM